MEALNREGFELKRSSVYLHLLPWNHRPIEGRRHVTTAPVKIYKSQNSKHASHWSTKFTHASIRSLEQLAAFFGLAFLHKMTMLKSLLGWPLQSSKHSCSCTSNIRSRCPIMILLWLLNTSWYPRLLWYEACQR